MTAIDFKGLRDWIEIFRSGRHTDASGVTREFSTADLDRMVQNFSEPVPHVITHEHLYSPFAYAQAEALKREGAVLLARSGSIEPQFERLIQDGRLYRRSVRLTNEADKGWQLLHIAWLGAEPPAVEGMAPVEFTAMAHFFDFSIITQGADMADINNEARAPAKDTQPPTVTVAEFSQLQTDFAAIKAKLAQAEADTLKAETDKAALQADFAKAQLALKRQQLMAEVSAWVGAKKMTPAEAVGAVEFMARLEATQTFDFSSGDETKTITPLVWFRDFMAARQALDLGPNQAMKESPISLTDDLDIARRASDYKNAMNAKGQYLSFAQAVDVVRAGKDQ